MTLTLSGYKGMIVKGLTLSMKSNSSKGAGYLSIKAGTTTLSSIGTSSSGVNFNDALWNGAWSTSYVNVKPTLSNTSYTVQKGEDIVIVIGATANSLYCQSFTIEYVADPSYVPELDAPVVSCTAQTETSLTFSWNAVANASGYQVSVDGGSTYGAIQSETSYTWTGITANTTKTLYVKAIGDGTNYTNSEAATAKGTTTAGSGSGEGDTEKTVEKTSGLQASTTATTMDSYISFVNSAGNNYSNPMRIYSGNTFTISATNAVITKVEFTCDTTDKTTEGLTGGTVTVDNGATSSMSTNSDSNVVTYTITGSTTSFAVKASAQFRVSGLKVTYKTN